MNDIAIQNGATVSTTGPENGVVSIAIGGHLPHNARRIDGRSSSEYAGPLGEQPLKFR
jgi:hypothetical protein